MSCGCRNSLDSGFPFEGGDVILTANYVFVGISHESAMHGVATDAHFLAHLEKHCQRRTPIPIKLQKDVLHLDLCFNILPFDDTVLGCIVCPALLHEWHRVLPQLLTIFGQRIVCVSIEEAAALVCNFLILAPGKILLSESKEANRVCKRIAQLGRIEIVKIDFNYVSKYLGGGIHCVTLPLRRRYGDQRGPIDVRDDIEPLLDVVVGIVSPDKPTSVCQNAIASINSAQRRKIILAKVHDCVENLCLVLQALGITVCRPSAEALLAVPACNALFARDVAVAIDQQLIYAQMHLAHRAQEGKAVLYHVLTD